MRFPAYLLVSTLLLACKSEPPVTDRASPSAHPPVVSTMARPAAASASGSAGPGAGGAPEPVVVRPMPAATEVTIALADGGKMAGSWYAAADPGAPVVILAHRLSGSRADWAPVLARLLTRGPQFHALAVDLRGHGATVLKAPRNPGTLDRADVELMGGDMTAALAFADQRLGHPAARFVVIGDELGATALVRAAVKEPRVTALALFSPGAALKGVDLYRPFAEVRTRSIYLAFGATDPVSEEPGKALEAMCKGQAQVRVLPGVMHGLPQLLVASPGLADDVAGWAGLVAGGKSVPGAASGEPAPSGAGAAPPVPSGPLPAPSGSAGKGAAAAAVGSAKAGGSKGLPGR
jgi:pimeloyl-ACP methyl ester carboxylesterase